MSSKVWFYWFDLPNSGCEISTTRCNNKSTSERLIQCASLKRITNCVVPDKTYTVSKQERLLFFKYCTFEQWCLSSKKFVFNKRITFLLHSSKWISPTLVYPTNATYHRTTVCYICVPICLSIARFCLSITILCRVQYVIVSISVSPGPRIPIPPFWRSLRSTFPERSW
jgi:hypothetical protein